jgi:hypothetical protein
MVGDAHRFGQQGGENLKAVCTPLHWQILVCKLQRLCQFGYAACTIRLGHLSFDRALRRVLHVGWRARDHRTLWKVAPLGRVRPCTAPNPAARLRAEGVQGYACRRSPLQLSPLARLQSSQEQHEMTTLYKLQIQCLLACCCAVSANRNSRALYQVAVLQGQREKRRSL